jgi:glycolate oxidase FAD binding subunit
MKALREAAAKARGHATLFIAPSAASESLERTAPLPEPLARIQQRLKAEFDPAGVFNPT